MLKHPEQVDAELVENIVTRGITAKNSAFRIMSWQLLEFVVKTSTSYVPDEALVKGVVKALSVIEEHDRWSERPLAHIILREIGRNPKLANAAFEDINNLANKRTGNELARRDAQETLCVFVTNGCDHVGEYLARRVGDTAAIDESEKVRQAAEKTLHAIYRQSPHLKPSRTRQTINGVRKGISFLKSLAS
jgi:hypothetical protein